MKKVEINIEEIAELNPNALLADGFEDAYLGIVTRAGSDPIALYSIKQCVEILMERDEMTDEEAIEFMDYNVLGGYLGEGTPMFLMDLDI